MALSSLGSNLILVINLVYVVGLVTFDPFSWTASVWSYLFWILMGAMALAATLRQSNRSPDISARRGWQYMAMACFLWLVGLCIRAWQELVQHHPNPSPGPSDIGPCGFGLFSFLAVLSLFKPQTESSSATHPSKTTNRILELFISFGMVALTTSLLLYSPLRSVTWDTHDILLPALNSLTLSSGLIFGVYLVTQSRPRVSWSSAFGLLAGLAVYLGAHFSYLYADSLEKYRAGHLTDELWVLAFSLIAASAAKAESSAENPDSQCEAETSERSPLISAFYWTFFLACLGIGLWSYRELIPTPHLIFFSCGFSLALLIVANLIMNWVREVYLRRATQSELRERNDFLSMASHELNTPLASLSLNLYLQEQLSPSPELLKRIRSAKRQVDHLTRIVQGMLSPKFYSMQNIKLQLSRENLVPLVRGVLTRLEDELARAGCEWHLDAPETAYAEIDALRIDQVISNLLTNAMKFGAGKPIDVLISTDQLTTTISIQDHGPGIDLTQQQKIFGQFRRGEDTKNVAGLGLGLYISKQIATAHNAKLWVESTPGHGARFKLELKSFAPLALGAKSRPNQQ